MQDSLLVGGVGGGGRAWPIGGGGAGVTIPGPKVHNEDVLF